MGREAKPSDFSKTFHLVPDNMNVLPRGGRRSRSRMCERRRPWFSEVL